MKTASLSHSPAFDAKRNPGFASLVLAVPQALFRAVRGGIASFPAIGLAEGGDVQGAADLLAQTRKN